MGKFDKEMEKETAKKIDEGEQLTLPENNKSIVDNIIKEHSQGNYNLITDRKKKTAVKKSCVSLYVENDDLKLLKAIAFDQETTVNKLILDILKTPLDYTKKNIPSDFDIDKLAQKYDHKKTKKNK